MDKHKFTITKTTDAPAHLPQTRTITVRPNIQLSTQDRGYLPGVVVAIETGGKNQSILLNKAQAEELAVALQFYAQHLHLTEGLTR